MKKLGFIGTIVLGGIAGAIGISLFIYLKFALSRMFPHYHGQYGTLFMATVSVGWLLGSVIGAEIVYRNPEIIQPRHALWLAIGLIVSGFLVGPFLVLLTMPLI